MITYSSTFGSNALAARWASPRRSMLALMLAGAACIVPVSGIPGAWIGQSIAYAADVTLDNIVVSDKGSTFTIKRVDVTDTNLGKDEILKLFKTETKGDEAAAIVRKLKAAKFSVPEIQIVDKDGFKGTLRDFVATNLNEGKFGKISIAGFDGSNSDGKKKTDVKIGNMVMDNADLAKLLDAAKDKRKPDPGAASQAVEHARVENIEIAIPAEGVPDALNRIRIASIEGTNDRAVLPKQKAVFEIRNLLFDPAKGSDEANSLSQYGYERLDLGMKLAGGFDEAAKILTLDDWTFSGVNVGSLTMRGELRDYVKPAAGAPDAAMQQALYNSSLSNVRISFANDGGFEKGLAVTAKGQDKTPEALKAEWSAIATAMLPVMLGGDPAGKTIGDAVSKFLAQPKNIAIGASAKGAPVKIIDLATAKSPQDVLSKINVTASANQ